MTDVGMVGWLWLVPDARDGSFVFDTELLDTDSIDYGSDGGMTLVGLNCDGGRRQGIVVAQRWLAYGDDLSQTDD